MRSSPGWPTRQKMIDPRLNPRIKDAVGIFKVAPTQVENNLLVARAMAGEGELKTGEDRPCRDRRLSDRRGSGMSEAPPRMTRNAWRKTVRPRACGRRPREPNAVAAHRHVDRRYRAGAAGYLGAARLSSARWPGQWSSHWRPGRSTTASAVLFSANATAISPPALIHADHRPGLYHPVRRRRGGDLARGQIRAALGDRRGA